MRWYHGTSLGGPFVLCVEPKMARWLLIAVALCALATVAGARAFNALALPRITTDVARLSAGRLFCPAGSDLYNTQPPCNP